MPFDSRLQTVAKVQDDRIVGRYAGLYGKLDDSIGAVIVSQLIESSSRNEKAKAVRRVFGMGRRIKGQIDETISELDPSKPLADQLGFNVKNRNRQIARSMSVAEIGGTDPEDFFDRVKNLLQE